MSSVEHIGIEEYPSQSASFFRCMDCTGEAVDRDEAALVAMAGAHMEVYPGHRVRAGAFILEAGFLRLVP